MTSSVGGGVIGRRGGIILRLRRRGIGLVATVGGRSHPAGSSWCPVSPTQSNEARLQTLPDIGQRIARRVARTVRAHGRGPAVCEVAFGVRGTALGAHPATHGEIASENPAPAAVDIGRAGGAEGLLAHGAAIATTAVTTSASTTGPGAPVFVGAAARTGPAAAGRTAGARGASGAAGLGIIAATAHHGQEASRPEEIQIGQAL